MTAPGELRQYGLKLAKHLWTTGAYVDGPILRSTADGSVELQIIASLPGPGKPAHASIEIVEQWVPVEGRWRLSSYAYELVDRELRRRRAFHLHDYLEFAVAGGQPAHEHCEEELGRPRCAHYAGIQLDDGHDAVDRLMTAWATPDQQLGCDELRCLDS